MFGTISPIPPPLGTNVGNTGSPNRVDTMPTNNDTINTMTTTNVAQNVVDENLPQLLDSRGGSHVTKVPEFEKEDFTSQKIRLLVFLDGLEPYFLKSLEDGPFVPLSNISTLTNPLRSDSDDEEDLRSSSEFIVDLNAEYHERAVLEKDEGIIKVKAFMEIVEEEPSVGKADAKSGQ
nr:hypothetical protein [Tanacetum cinerariifolium]